MRKVHNTNTIVCYYHAWFTGLISRRPLVLEISVFTCTEGIESVRSIYRSFKSIPRETQDTWMFLCTSLDVLIMDKFQFFKKSLASVFEDVMYLAEFKGDAVIME